MDKPMSMQEKTNLGNNIRLLSPDQLRGIISILSDPNSVESNLKYFEFDIENLPVRKLRELEKYVSQSMKEVNKKSNNMSEREKIDQLKVSMFKLPTKSRQT